jgi:excisionase family DNA binding protein
LLFGIQARSKERVTDMSTQVQDELLTVHEMAESLRVDDTTVRRWIKNGALAAVSLPHVGKRQAYRIRKTTLEALLAATTIVSA